MRYFICLILTLTSVYSQTFKICDQRKTDKPLPEVDGKYLAKMVYGPYAEATSLDKNIQYVPTSHHPVIYAAFRAFAEHRRLVLSPDIVWLMISQGFATHIRENSEKFRKELVDFTGSKKLTVRRDEFKLGDPKNDWFGVVQEFNLKIKTNKNLEKILVGDFSTTDSNALTAYRIAHMDSVSKYYDYEMMTLCGIPEITLEGTTEDWVKMLRKVDEMNDYRLRTWVKGLKPILQQFVHASRGHVNQQFWESIFKVHGKSGGPYVTGWLLNFFPYTANNKPRQIIQFDKDYNMMNVKEAHYEHAFPRGQSNVPFKWIYFDKSLEMEFKGGFLGIIQNKTDMSVKPNIGWAVVRKHNEKIIEGRLPYWQTSQLYPEKGQEIDFEKYCSVRYLSVEVDKDIELAGVSKLKVLESLGVEGPVTGAFLEELSEHSNLKRISWSWKIEDQHLPLVKKTGLTGFFFRKDFNRKTLSYLPETVRSVSFGDMDVDKNMIQQLRPYKNLSELYFRECKISAEAIAEIGSLDLNALTVTECNFQEDTLNSTLNELKNLYKLTISRCALEKPLTLSNPLLEELDLTRNNLNSVKLIDLNNLKSLFLSSNKLEKMNIEAEKLSKLTLFDNKLFLLELKTPKLDYLSASNNQLSGLPDISEMPLKELWISGNPILESGFPKKFPKSLEALNINGIRLSTAMKKAVSECTSVVTLRIEHSNIHDGDAWLFKDMKKLKSLYLSKNKAMSEASKFWVRKMINAGINVYAKYD